MAYRKKQEKIVYILGAGFSKDAGGLLMKDFLRKARLNSRRNTLNKKYPFLKRFMQQAIEDGLIGKHRNSETDWNVEDFFNLVAEADLLDLKFKRTAGRNWDASKIYRSLVDCIANELLISMRMKLRNTNSQLPRQYINFAKKCLTEDATIISFNWDHIPERLLYEKFGYFDYCIDNVRRIDRSIGNISRGIKLLKLHGSVNWLYCDNPNHPIHVYNSWQAQRVRLDYCIKCDYQLSKLIVPPVWHKRDFAQRIGELWETAADELCIADRIVVIGYSLRSLDFSAKHLLLLSNYLNRKVKVEIVNGPNFDKSVYKQVFIYAGKIKNTNLFFKEYVSAVV